MHKTLVERFWEKVDKRGGPNTCWPWLAATMAGYGVIKDEENIRLLRAHRLAWEIHNRPIPDGLCVCHICDNPACVNPCHLRLGTHKDNAQDRERKGRGSGAKLTASQVQEIRNRCKQGGVIQRALALEFKVGDSAVSKILLGKTWPIREGEDL